MSSSLIGNYYFEILKYRIKLKHYLWYVNYFNITLFLIALDKEMRNWDTYINLEATVKNMLTSLRAVGELQNPAIRERHWHQLMKATKVAYFLHLD